MSDRKLRSLEALNCGSKYLIVPLGILCHEISENFASMPTCLV
jgi:hypothetical protein